MTGSALFGERFDVGDECATGGSARILRGVDRTTGEPVAIKVLGELSPVELRRLHREAELLASLSHPHIARYIAHGLTPDGVPYLVEEWLAGPTLTGHLDGTGLTAGESVALAQRVADALAHVHAHRAVHRDIKPDNLVLVDGDPWRVKVIDFGIARMADTRGLTRTGTLLGTLGYMAPEQARGERDVGPLADLFALGCVLYECLTGHPAFAGRNDTAVWAKVLLLEPAPVRSLNPEVPPALDALVARLLAKQRGARPTDAAAVAAELARIEVPVSPRRRRRRGTEAPTRMCLPRTPEAAPSYVMHVAAPGEAGGGHEPLSPAVAELAARFASSVEPMADGSSLMVFLGVGAAAGAVAQVARCALALGQLDAHLAISVCEVTGPSESIDRIAAVAHRLEFARLWRDHIDGGAAAPSICVDPATAARLQGRFDLRPNGDSFALVGELVRDP